MKILAISEYFPPLSKGGGEISAHLLLEEIAKTHEVHVLTTGPLPPTKSPLIIHDVLKGSHDTRTILGNVKRGMSFFSSLNHYCKRLCKQNRIDLVHCFNSTSIPAVGVKKELKIPFILHVNAPTPFCPKGTLMYKDQELCNYSCSTATFFDCFMHSSQVGKMQLSFPLKYNPLFGLLIRRRYQYFQKHITHFDHYFPISSFMQDRLIKEGINKVKTTLIPNIVDLSGFEHLKLEQHSPKRILYLGEYSSPKGADLVLSALLELSVQFEASFYGDGYLREQLIKQATSNISINEKVSYGDIPHFMQNHDIVVIPSQVGEAFSRVALEALAAKKIVVAAKIGGITDIISDNNGVLFKAGSKISLIQALTKALTTKTRVTAMLPSKFKKDNIVKKVFYVYDSLK